MISFLNTLILFMSIVESRAVHYAWLGRIPIQFLSQRLNGNLSALLGSTSDNEQVNHHHTIVCQTHGPHIVVISN
jgi:hypothetical protein